VERRSDTDSVDKLFHAGVANHYISDELGYLNVSMQGKNSYVKILEDQD
jgi:hypothetical protein